jgi:AcrR family transcriptional regulator
VAEKGSGAQDMALELPDLGPLLGGHHGLSPEQVAESQRERLLAAVAGIVGEQGYRAATIAKIVKAASVSTRDFYDHFSSVEECFLAAFEAVVANLEALVANGVEAIPDWPDRVVAALRVALDFFTEEPQLARVCLIEPVSATPATALRFHEAVSQCVPLLSQGRALHSGGGSLPRSTEDSLLGGAVSIVTRSMLGGAVLSELLPDLVEFMLSPYVGAERAKQLAASSGSF